MRLGAGAHGRRPWKSLSEEFMSTSQSTSTRMQRIGMAVFVLAVLATGTMITMGVLGIPWPRWLLALATIL